MLAKYPLSEQVKRLEEIHEKTMFLLEYFMSYMELNIERGNIVFSSKEAENSWQVSFDDVFDRYSQLKSGDEGAI